MSAVMKELDTESRDYNPSALNALNMALLRGRAYDDLLLEQSPSLYAIAGGGNAESDLVVRWLSDDYKNHSAFLIGIAPMIASQCLHNSECIVESTEIFRAIAAQNFREDLSLLASKFHAPAQVSDSLLALARRAVEGKRVPSDEELAKLASDLSRFTD